MLPETGYSSANINSSRDILLGRKTPEDANESTIAVKSKQIKEIILVHLGVSFVFTAIKYYILINDTHFKYT